MKMIQTIFWGLMQIICVIIFLVLLLFIVEIISSSFHACAFILPSEIKALIYPGAHTVCWSKKYNRLDYEIGDYNRASGMSGYNPGTKEGSSEGVYVVITFKNSPNFAGSYYIDLNKDKVEHGYQEKIPTLRYDTYQLDGKNVSISITTSQWGKQLSTDPYKLINYIIREAQSNKK
jgi:hypothetical protein